MDVSSRVRQLLELGMVITALFHRRLPKKKAREKACKSRKSRIFRDDRVAPVRNSKGETSSSPICDQIWRAFQAISWGKLKLNKNPPARVAQRTNATRGTQWMHAIVKDWNSCFC